MKYANLDLNVTAQYSLPIDTGDGEGIANFDGDALAAAATRDWTRNLTALFGSMSQETEGAFGVAVHHTTPQVSITVTVGDDRGEGQRSNDEAVEEQMTDLLLAMFGLNPGDLR